MRRTTLSRRTMLKGATALGALAAASGRALAQSPAQSPARSAAPPC
jgi:hypothetical protein